MFRGGTYRGLDGQPLGNFVDGTWVPKQLTLQAYPHEKPWIKGSLEVTGWVREEGKNVWRKDGWTYEFTPMPAVNVDPAFPMAGHLDQVYVNGKSMVQVGSLAAVGPGTFYVDNAGDRLYIGNDPAGKIIEATAFANAFNRFNNLHFFADNMVFRGLGFAHYADILLVNRTRGSLVENCSFVWNGRSGFSMQIFSNGMVRGNTFSYNGQSGLIGNFANNTVVEDNLISRNNVENFRRAWSAAGMKVIRTNGMTVRNNLVEHNNGHAIWFDVEVDRTVIINNVVRRNSGSIGIFFEISNGPAYIAGNVSMNNAFGIAVVGSTNAYVYNNTLVNNVRSNLRVGKDNRPDYPNATSRNNFFQNNILSNVTGLLLPNVAGPFLVDVWKACADKDEMVAALDYNAYYRTDAAMPPNLIRWVPFTDACQKTFADLEAFRAEPTIAQKGFEQHGFELSGPDNPFFVDEAAGDFRLKAGSSAVNAGLPLSEALARELGWEAGVPVSMGAFQEVVYPPAAPANLVATALSQRTVQLTWDDQADDEEGFRVERATAGGALENVGVLGPDAAGFRDTDLQADTRYRYRVVAFNKAGASPAAEASVTTLPAGTGLAGTYYQTKHFYGPSFTRVDATVDFDWGKVAPAELPGPNAFSVRWEGQVEARHSETYTLKTVTDDGVRLWLNGALLIDDWTHRGERTHTATVPLEADTRYTIRLEYYENDGNALAKLYWASPSQAEEIIPQAQLYPATELTLTGTADSRGEQAAGLQVYPNPARDRFMVRVAVEQEQEVEIRLTNALSEQVLAVSEKLAAGQHLIPVLTHNLPNGVYFLTLVRGQRREVAKVVVAK